MLEMSDEPVNFSSTLGIAEHEFRLVFGRTKIDYDKDKDNENRRKHKYSLESAVWLLERMLLPVGVFRPHVVSDSFFFELEDRNEVRHMHMCVDDGGNIVFMVTTMREDETVRVISLRPAHQHERARFCELTGWVAYRSNCANSPSGQLHLHE